MHVSPVDEGLPCFDLTAAHRLYLTINVHLHAGEAVLSVHICMDKYVLHEYSMTASHACVRMTETTHQRIHHLGPKSSTRAEATRTLDLIGFAHLRIAPHVSKSA